MKKSPPTLSAGIFSFLNCATISLPTIILTSKGAKTGQPRAAPLVAIPDGEKIILVASNWGGMRYPAWYHNLRANPHATVLYNGVKQTYIARQAVERECDAYRERAVSLYKGYAAYKNRTPGRPIPLMILELTKG